MTRSETSLSIAARAYTASASGPNYLNIALVRTSWHDAIVCSALAVDGGIYRREFVACVVINGLMRAQLDGGVPVLSVVLTPKDFHEHATHRDFFSQHFIVKGAEAAHAVAQTPAAHAALAA